MKGNPFYELIEHGQGKAPLNIEQAGILYERLTTSIQNMLQSKDNKLNDAPVWYTQSQIAKRLNLKGKSQASLYCYEAVNSGMVRTIEVGLSGRNKRYHIDDFESFMMHRGK